MFRPIVIGAFVLILWDIILQNIKDENAFTTDMDTIMALSIFWTLLIILAAFVEFMSIPGKNFAQDFVKMFPIRARVSLNLATIRTSITLFIMFGPAIEPSYEYTYNAWIAMIYGLILIILLSHQSFKIKVYLSIYDLKDDSLLYKNITSLLPLILSIRAFIISILSPFSKNKRSSSLPDPIKWAIPY